MDENLMKTLADGAAAIGVPLGPAELDLFSAYHRELILWNSKFNLMSERSSREIVIRHFLDSLTAFPFLNQKDGSLIDLGSGGGFPGVPLKIVLPRLQVSLVEASRKKSSFLSHLIRVMGLSGIRAIRTRVEEMTSDPSWAGRFDTLISRAAFKLPDLIRAASFFLKPGGCLIAMKGPDPQEELTETERFLEASGMVIGACRDIRPPGAESSRKIIIYNRVFG